MSFALKRFCFLPRASSSTPWTSGELRFGRFLTFLDADNGAGKTPLMRGIAAALGHSLELPPEVVENCIAARLEVEADGQAVVLERNLGVGFELRLQTDDRDETFTSEREFADELLGLLGMPERLVTTTKGQASPLYPPVLLPLFYVDQDTGWHSEYAPPSNKRFIESQAEEVIRFALGLPARHPFRGDEVEFLTTRARELVADADRLRALLERQRHSAELALDSELDVLQAQVADARDKLNRLQDGIDTVEDATKAVDRELRTLDASLAEQRATVRSVSAERTRLNKIAAELGAEIEILATNNTAKSAFVSFCGNENCQLFKKSEQTFGKQLLYLKDQLKDLASTDGLLSAEIERLESEVHVTQERRKGLLSSKQQTLNQKGHSAAVRAIQQATRRLADTELQLRRRQSYEKSINGLQSLAEETEEVESRLEELRKGTPLVRTGDLRKTLKAKMQRWLGVLATRNVREAEFDASFRLSLDERRFSGSSHHSGSTRTRIVLALHAALLETGLGANGHHPRLLILDAPRQHELHEQDIKKYLDELRQLSQRVGGGIQIVVAAAKLKLEVPTSDMAWTPSFFLPGEEKPHYLGPTSNS